MPATITPQNATEVANCLGTLEIAAYRSAVGKLISATQQYRAAWMATLAGATSTNPGGRQRTAATTTTTGPIGTPRRRGRPPGPTSTTARAPRARKSKNTGAITLSDAVLKTVSLGFTTPNAILPELQRTYGIKPRPNHVGAALKRHLTAGRLAKSGEGTNAVWAATKTGQDMAKAA